MSQARRGVGRSLASLVSNLGSVTGLNSVDTATISSSGTVTAANKPIAYNITETAASGGYILPDAFTFTFPAGLSVNTALVGAEVNAAANGTTPAAIAAVEANPTGTPIGTVTLTSPIADSYGGSNNKLVGKIYVVQTGASSGQGSVTQPYLELWFGPYIYTLGAFPGSLSFPLTIQFGKASTPLGANPLPTTSLAMSFPAATSPVKSTSCTTLGTVTGTATDDVANLAYLFGDKSDGVSSASGTASPVNLTASATAVTNHCVKPSATGSAGGLTSGHPTLTLKAKTVTAFTSVDRRPAGWAEVREVEEAGQGSLSIRRQDQVGQNRRWQAGRHAEEQGHVHHDQDQERCRVGVGRTDQVDQEAQDQEAHCERQGRQHLAEGIDQGLISASA